MPFLTIYTPTYRRPKGLATCMASVQAQTVANDIEHLVIPDLVGRGVGGMYQQVSLYKDAVHGMYVVFLCDDDVLAEPDVVEKVRGLVAAHNYPGLLLVHTQKNGTYYPRGLPWPPKLGMIDLNCAIVRADVWKRHVNHYGSEYEGDYHFLQALYKSSVSTAFYDLLFSIGGVSRGAAE